MTPPHLASPASSSARATSITLSPVGHVSLSPGGSIVSGDETNFPRGQCRYILLTPGLRGQRCGCVNFHHNRVVPGAICDCGHLSCYHVTDPDKQASPGRNQTDIGFLRQRVQTLEGQVGSRHGEREEILARVGQLEEALDKAREEAQAEIKDSYRSISGAWQLVEQMQRRMAAFEDSHRQQGEQLQKTTNEFRDLRNRHLELADGEESLEERIEKLEGADLVEVSPAGVRRRSISILETPSPMTTAGIAAQRRRRSSAARPFPALSVSTKLTTVERIDTPTPPSSSPFTGPWTVHVSLLPSSEQPFPFEKDTMAYRRCLSRGLLRMVAIQGQDAQSFINAVSNAFLDVLHGRPWAPLQIRLCQAERFQDTPMLRPLEAGLLHGKYDVDFLKKHCAMVDDRGRIESLYVAMRHDRLSWEGLRQAPVFVEGLESVWAPHRFLDRGQDGGDNDASESTRQKKSQPSHLTGTKRGVAEILTGTGCSESGEREVLRNKLPRTSHACMPGRVDVHRGLGTA